MVNIDLLEKQIQNRKKELTVSKLSQSFGSLRDMYKKGNLVINPKFQRFFRWDKEQKTNFIESILLGLPIPPIFVSKKGKEWQLVDGLQRLSTMFEFFGDLEPHLVQEGKSISKSGLLGTEYLPDLAGAKFENIGEDIRFDLESNYPIDIIILEDSGTSNDAKYELFYRLNTGGSSLSNQEVRSAILIMENESLYDKFKQLSEEDSFLDSVLISEKKSEKQQGLEYVLRYFSVKNYNKSEGKIKYVKYFLDRTNLKFTKKFNTSNEIENFKSIFGFISDNFDDSPFRQYVKEIDKFKGGMNISAFDIITSGLGYCLENGLIDLDKDKNRIINKIKLLTSNDTFKEETRVGISSEGKINFSIKFGREYFL